MGFFTRFQMMMARFMVGRNGMDNMAFHALWGSVIISILSMFLPIPGIISTVLMVYAIFRMLSRNVAKRRDENQRYIEFTEKITREVKQFFLRLKGRKTHKYFRCPSCRNRLRMKRGSGEKMITCPVCRNQFSQKA
ncbi:MAG: hypothetical protein IJE07_09635 [Clostridia bacterium]|nr:hypothetical protein [Clostridia bacterium]